MALWLRADESGFAARFETFLSSKREVSEDIDSVVREIIKRVRAEGDAALLDFTSRFDRLDLTSATLAVSAAEIDAAMASADPDIIAALEFARDRIESHHHRR